MSHLSSIPSRRERACLRDSLQLFGVDLERDLNLKELPPTGSWEMTLVYIALARAARRKAKLERERLNRHGTRLLRARTGRPAEDRSASFAIDILADRLMKTEKIVGESADIRRMADRERFGAAEWIYETWRSSPASFKPVKIPAIQTRSVDDRYRVAWRARGKKRLIAKGFIESQLENDLPTVEVLIEMLRK